MALGLIVPERSPDVKRALCNRGAMDRAALPQLATTTPFIADGGLETSLIFRQGVALPAFAAFTLLRDEAGCEQLRAYYRPYLALARERGIGIVLDTPTWRANPDWGTQLGYDAAALAHANHAAVELVAQLAAEARTGHPVLVAGGVGPRGDGYVAGERMTAAEAAAYHAPQLDTFATAGADLASALTLSYAEEAIGFVRAATAAGLPAVASFTVETDGRLPSGQPLRDAIEQVDGATDGAAAYFMVNCAHPTHFAPALEQAGAWRERIRGVRANASARSHVELDADDALDDGDPLELATRYRELHERLPWLTVLGGCCGTDERHLAAICDAVLR
jgi:S-methylmethionine-dependent homocysteine/selenocysteine methylase